MKRHIDFLESLMQGVFFLCGFVAVAFVLLIMVYLVGSGIPAIREIGVVDFLFGLVWDPTNKTDPRFGILALMLTTVCAAVGAAVLGVPVAFLTALFLAKAAPAPLGQIIRGGVKLLAGIPSVVYGLVGMTVLLPAIREHFGLAVGDSLLAAIIVLAVMILPVVMTAAETALSAVPWEYEEASLALGATEVETWLRVSAPAAKNGVAAAVILGIGRAVGEAMAVLMVAGNVANMPDLLTSVKSLTTAVAGELSYASGLQREALFSIGLVLFLFIMMINLLLNIVVKKEGK